MVTALLALATGLAQAQEPQSPGASSQAAKMDYHDVSEADNLLLLLDASPHARLFTIGYSYDYKTDPGNPSARRIRAIRISADTPDSVEDNYQKNAILFECGMHPREWLTSESCLMLAKYLVDHIADTGTAVPELLRAVDVWIIPMSNPAGRAIDDTHGGDPTQYSTSPLADGWRGNGDTRLCQYGVNVARNFSRGFNDAGATVYCSGNYRGFAPFSTSEASALRQFVENHNISMVVLLHSPGQQIWNQWGNGDTAGNFVINEAARIWRAGWSNPSDQTRYDLAREGVGGGNGQFSAWLSYPSTRSGNEIDASSGPWGLSGDVPLAGDFDRDGQMDDVAIYRPSNHYWYYDYDHDGDTDETRGPWAQVTGDQPLAGDFDRDGKVDDVAIHRLSDYKWYYDYDHDGDTDETRGPWAQRSGDLPLAGDFDRDGKVDDVAVFRTWDYTWHYDYDHDGDTDETRGPWARSGDLPMAGDFDRDGKVDDVAVFRPSNRIWYYDLDHDGDTDHVSGPWGWDGDLPVVGDFNSDGYIDDVAVYRSSDRTWYYDYLHNATIRQPDEGSLRAIQTIMIELPFKDENYYDGPYQASHDDGSNTFHPSGSAVQDLIEDSFIPMALYLIRQARSPGCPTQSDGTPYLARCPTQDFGIVAARIGSSPDGAGTLVSHPAQRTSWDQVSVAYDELPTGSVLFYRVQNFSNIAWSFDVRARVEWIKCTGEDCWGAVDTYRSSFANVPVQGAVSSAFILNIQDADCTITLEVRPRGGFESGATDSFLLNDKKVFRFHSTTNATRRSIHLPLVVRNY